MKECKIVQDLLELYSEGLTNNITNTYIEVHVGLCNKCKRKFKEIKNCDKTECKVFYDLLPNYIEKITGKTTNKYIEQHIKTCNRCNQALIDMTSNL